jgi:predicted nucleic acid-binding protein
MIFVDANYFLRYLAQPATERAQAQAEHEIATTLFTLAQREDIEITSSDAVIAEVAFVLGAKRHYGLPPEIVSGLLKPILELAAFKLPSKRQCLRALDLWVTIPRLGFVDALGAAYAELHQLTLATFDSDIVRLQGFARWQPMTAD